MPALGGVIVKRVRLVHRISGSLIVYDFICYEQYGLNPLQWFVPF